MSPAGGLLDKVHARISALERQLEQRAEARDRIAPSMAREFITMTLLALIGWGLFFAAIGGWLS